MKSLKSNKASGHDKIPAKILKIGADVLCFTLLPLFNHCIVKSVFPDDFKRAEVRPIHKKGDILSKENYRPVSVLTACSKALEGILCDQINSYLDGILSPMLCAYRQKRSCANVLLKCTEDFKQALDRGDVVGCIMMDLSKAFDMIPYDLLLAKLSAYGFSSDACQLVSNYLHNRLQRVRIGQVGVATIIENLRI